MPAKPANADLVEKLVVSRLGNIRASDWTPSLVQTVKECAEKAAAAFGK